MKHSTLNILRGIGSIFDIMPAHDRHSANLPKGKTAMEIMESSWAKVGQDLTKAIGEFTHDQKAKRPRPSQKHDRAANRQ